MKLGEKVFEFECEVSGEDFANEVKDEIFKLKHLEDVKEYYMNYRGWRDSESLRELVVDLIIDLKMD
jgi:hypothetical protein